jgi:hypothetical protein
MFTRRSPTRTVLLTSCLFLAGLALMSLPASAQASLRRTQKREPQRISNAQLREALHVLQVTKKTLEGADHDYGGHRVDAIKAIGAAQHQLKLALETQTKSGKPGGKTGSRPGGKPGRPGKGGGKEPEPQNISNMQLADAIPILQQTRTLLEKADHDYGGHRAAAVRDLGTAIQQLKIALEFEKKREK